MIAQMRGAKAKSAGDEFEDELDRYHAALLRAELAYVWQSYPKLRFFGDRIGWQPGGKGAFDRWGSLYTGRPVYFELKHRKAKDYFTWMADDVHQLSALRTMAHVTQGMALCWVLVDWEYKDTKELRLHWITDIPDLRVDRETGTWVKNRRWMDTLEDEGLIEVPDVNVQYLHVQSDPGFGRIREMWANGQLAMKGA